MPATNRYEELEEVPLPAEELRERGAGYERNEGEVSISGRLAEHANESEHANGTGASLDEELLAHRSDVDRERASNFGTRGRALLARLLKREDPLAVPLADPPPPTAATGDAKELASLRPALGPDLGPARARAPVSCAITGWRRTYYVVVYCATIMMLYADQNLMAPTMSDIASEFGFDDKEKDLYLGAFISGAFFAVGAPAALVVGFVSDRVNRKWLLFALVLVGEGPCLATFWVEAYWQLFLLRLMTGISLGGCLPLAYAMVGDLYDTHTRASVSAWVQLCSGAGIAVGQATAGFVGPWLGWRAPFVVVAIPALALATLLALTTTDPPRGACEEVLEGKLGDGYVYTEKMNWHKIKLLLRMPSNVCVILQGLPGCLPWGIILIYLNDFLAIPSGKDLGTQTATVVLLVNGVGGAVGVLGGGALGQYLYNRHKPWMPLMVGSSVLLAVPFMYLLLNASYPNGWVALAFVSAAAVGCLASVPGPNVRAILLNVNEPEARGLALALQTVLDDLGKGLGPFLIGMLVQVVGRVWAFNIAVLGWIPCGLLLLAASRYIEGDEAAMQTRLQLVANAGAELVPQNTIRSTDSCEGVGGGVANQAYEAPTAGHARGEFVDDGVVQVDVAVEEAVSVKVAMWDQHGDGGVVGGREAWSPRNTS